jgi:hypothetical protein
MIECQYCGEFLDKDADALGARCPRCREPLHERAGGPRLLVDGGRDAERGACAAHPDNAAVGTCQRCGNFVCRVCRTPWEGRGLCLTCAGRILEEREKKPEDAQVTRRQAVMSLTFGLLAWGLVLVGGLLGALGGLNRAAAALVILGTLLVLLSLLPAVFGVGQAVAAIRARGDRLILATWGLVLCSVHLGVLTGLPLVLLWRQ